MEKVALVLFAVLSGVLSSREIRMRCPEPTKDSPMAVYNMAWVCELVRWRNALADFKEQFEKQCNVTDFEARWESLFQCPNFSNISCADTSSLDDRTDSFNCSIIFCKDGQYAGDDALPGIWRQHFHFHRNIMNFSESINCTRECPNSVPPVKEASCFGKCCVGTDDSCLSSGNGKTCFCDSNCVLSGDCCSDYHAECEKNVTTIPTHAHMTTTSTTIRQQTEGSSTTQEPDTFNAQTLEACSGGVQINGIYGTISSPNYPSNYPNDAYCTWEITVPEGMVIAVNSDGAFNIEYEENCSYDALTFHGYMTLCGFNGIPSFNTTNNHLQVYFTSDSYTTRGGFSFTWTAVMAPPAVETTTEVSTVPPSSTEVLQGTAENNDHLSTQTAEPETSSGSMP